MEKGHAPILPIFIELHDVHLDAEELNCIPAQFQSLLLLFFMARCSLAAQ